MRSIALVSVQGSIDFLCFPNFDSPTIFAALLDAERGGSFSLNPDLEDMRVKQLYLPDTNILLTRFLSELGVAEVTDFMPVVGERAGDKGKNKQRYGQPRHPDAARHQGTGSLRDALRTTIQLRSFRPPSAPGPGLRSAFIPDSPDCPSMALYATFPLHVDGADAKASFTLNAGETAMMAFGQVDEEEKTNGAALDPANVEEHFQETSRFWRTWVSRSNYTGRWREMVNRSALALKLLCSAEHGSLVAAATFGLPERIGGSANWDYRYTWLRDSSFSLYAFMRLGFVEEARAFAQWIRNRLRNDAEHGPLQVMYHPDGRQDLDEISLDSLSGYRNSRPVRIGNGAYDQLQLDIYGELSDAVYLFNKYDDGISYDGWHNLQRMLEWLTNNWREPDEGIWEVRGGRREFLHSRLMCWVAFDRAIRLAESVRWPDQRKNGRKPATRFTRISSRISGAKNSSPFVQYKGSNTARRIGAADAAHALYQPHDSRWLSTLAAIEKNLTEDALVYRYDNIISPVDGLSGSEGSFTACSFWFIECLARSHQTEKARLLFDKMLGYANHLVFTRSNSGQAGNISGTFLRRLPILR